MTAASTGWMAMLYTVLVAVTCAAPYGSQATFVSPDEAAGALLAAFESGDYPLFLWVAGQQMAGFWRTGDPERDALDRARFLDAARQNGIKADATSSDRRILYIGRIEQPFPAPLVKTDSGWRFDGEAGFRELVTQRIRQNEIAVVEVCQRFRDAQYTYFGLANGGGRGFADRLRSTPGQHDGLFWSDSGEDESPLGPPFAAAAFAERQPDDGTRPLFGYYFKILTAQGPDAIGGALDYRVNGRLRRGFALIAWPAEHGVDGLHSFLMNHFGDIYQKDLGADTGRIAESITAFNPDRGWSRFEGSE